MATISSRCGIYNGRIFFFLIYYFEKIMMTKQEKSGSLFVKTLVLLHQYFYVWIKVHNRERSLLSVKGQNKIKLSFCFLPEKLYVQRKSAMKAGQSYY
jgi:hypothetical protein